MDLHPLRTLNTTKCRSHLVSEFRAPLRGAIIRRLETDVNIRHEISMMILIRREVKRIPSLEAVEVRREPMLGTRRHQDVKGGEVHLLELNDGFYHIRLIVIACLALVEGIYHDARRAGDLDKIGQHCEKLFRRRWP